MATAVTRGGHRTARFDRAAPMAIMQGMDGIPIRTRTFLTRLSKAG